MTTVNSGSGRNGLVRMNKAGMQVSVPDALIVTVYQEACKAEADYAFKAVVCGLLLREKRAELAVQAGRVSHSGKPSLNGSNQHNDGDSFLAWMQSAGISKSRGYRWMESAEVVARRQLGLGAGADVPMTIDVGGEVVSLSQALTAPEEDLPEQALEFRQATFDFMADKTLSEAVRSACDGDSPSSRIDRAANGKLKGGTAGENRKDYPLFVLRKLKEMGAHLAHWDTMDAVQRNEVVGLFRAAVMGDFASLPGRAAGKARMQAWPVEVCEAIQTVLKTYLKR